MMSVLKLLSLIFGNMANKNITGNVKLHFTTNEGPRNVFKSRTMTLKYSSELLKKFFESIKLNYVQAKAVK